MKTRITAAEIADRLSAELAPVKGGPDVWLARTLFQLLAGGEPVELGRLAGAVGRPVADVAATLSRPAFKPLIYLDDDGAIIGFSGLGLASLGETVLRLSLDGRQLYAWCAADTLFLPAALGTEMRVESRCPVTGREISLTVSPDGYRDITPVGAAMSMLSPDEISARLQRGEDVIHSLCRWILFFSSQAAAREWTAERPGTVTFPIEEGFELGRRLLARKWGLDPFPRASVSADAADGGPL
jgi:alkylmercury lyase